VPPFNTVFVTGIPKPDGWFDYVHQRLLIAAIPKDAWQDHLRECARVCASGGWIELIETNAILVGSGPAGEQYNHWVRNSFLARDIDLLQADKLDVLLEEAGFINIEKIVYKFPLGRWGGRAGALFAEDFKLLNYSLKPLFTKVFNISDEVVEANVEQAMKELEEHQAYAEFYVYVAQKP
jgi:SAM-dependent methyltransferase